MFVNIACFHLTLVSLPHLKTTGGNDSEISFTGLPIGAHLAMYREESVQPILFPRDCYTPLCDQVKGIVLFSLVVFRKHKTC